MKLNLSDCIRPFYYFCKIFGLSVIQSTRLCGFEYIYILIIFVFNIVCSIRSAFYAYANIQEYFEIQNLLMFISTHYLVLAPFLNLVHYRFINHRLKLLIELTNNLFETKLSMTRSEYCRLFFMVTVMPYCFIIVAITVLIVDFNYNCDILINFDVQIYLLALYLWLLIPTLQYLCWVLIFKYIFNKSVKLLFDVVFRIMLRMPEIRQNDIISNYYHFRIRNILNLIKITLKIKSEIIDLYGFFVILHVGHDLSFLIHNIYSIINSNCLEWKSILPRWMLLITSLYLPFWISTKTSNHIKETLYKIQILVIKERSSKIMKQLENFCKSFLHRNATFRMLDLLDLTNKQILYLISVGASLIVIQLQLYFTNHSTVNG